MDLLGGYASDDDDAGTPSNGAVPAAATSTAGNAASEPLGMVLPVITPATGLNLSALLPSASQSLTSLHALEDSTSVSKKRKKTPEEKQAKEEKRQRKEAAKRQKTEAEEAKTASGDALADAFSVLTQSGPDLRSIQSAGSMGLKAMLPPPKFAAAAPTDTSQTTATPTQARSEQDVEMHPIPTPTSTSTAQPPAAVPSLAEPTSNAPTTIAATNGAPTIRPPPGMRLPPGIRAAVLPSSNAAAASGASIAGVSTSAMPAAAQSNAASTPTAPVTTSHLQEDNEPYVPLYARAQMQQQPAQKGDKRHNPLSQLGNLHGQDKFVRFTSL